MEKTKISLWKINWNENSQIYVKDCTFLYGILVEVKRQFDREGGNVDIFFPLYSY